MPLVGFKLICEAFSFGFEHFLLFCRDCFILTGFANRELHSAGFEIIDLDILCSDFGHTEVAGVDFFEFQVGEVQSKAVFFSWEFKAQRDATILKFYGMNHRDSMIGNGVKSDMHRAILQIDLLVSFCSFLTVRRPALPDFFLGIICFFALKVVFEDQGGFFFRARSQGKE